VSTKSQEGQTMMAGHGPFSEDRGVVNLTQESSP
jgi:hypothetical protein